MQAMCSRCGTPHALSDEQIGEHDRVRYRCSRCGHTNLAKVPPRPHRTQAISPLPSFARGDRPAGPGDAFSSEERWHCAIEVKDDVVRLRHLDSTNGTYFEEECVRAAELRHLADFRIGFTVVRLSIT